MGLPRSSAGLRHLKTLFTAGTVAPFRTENCWRSTSLAAMKSPSRRLWSGTGRWSFRSAGVCSATLTMHRMPFRPRFWSWHDAPLDPEAGVGGELALWSRGAGRGAGTGRGSPAAKARVRRCRDGPRVNAGPGVPWPDSEQERHQLDRAAALHEEVARLPQKYGEPVVLCYLEGKTYQEVADKLRRPIGTVKVHLSRAREILRGRLARRGLDLAAALAAVELGAESARAAVPQFLVRSRRLELWQLSEPENWPLAESSRLRSSSRMGF